MLASLMDSTKLWGCTRDGGGMGTGKGQLKMVQGRQDSMGWRMAWARAISRELS